MTLLIGIDPGCSGAIALIDASSMAYVSHMLMPVMKMGKSSRVNGAVIYAFLNNYTRQYNLHAYIELVGAMPGQGRTSMFTFGHAAGKAEAVIECLGIPYTMVTPQVWKKNAGLIGKDKDAARTRAIQLYPHLRDLDLKGEGQAIADAILLARYNTARMEYLL